MRHSFSAYDDQLNLLGASQGEDLFAILSGMNPLLVDSNVDWKTRSESEPLRAFVVGRTVITEADNLQGVLFNRKVSAGRPNVFVFGLEKSASNETGCFVIHRLDEAFKECFGCAIPTLGELQVSDIVRFNDPTKRLATRNAIADLLRKPYAELRILLSGRLAHAYRNYQASCLAADIAYAVLLLSQFDCDKVEREKFLSNDANLFGDMCLIQEALFLGVRLLTNDKSHVRRMAAYCDISCER